MRTRRRAALIVVLVLGLLIPAPGCMSIVNQVGYFTGSTMQYLTDPDIVIFGGTRSHFHWMSDVPRRWREYEADFLLPLVPFMLDVPFSLVADIVLLPLTIGEEIGMWQAQEAAEAAAAGRS